MKTIAEKTLVLVLTAALCLCLSAFADGGQPTGTPAPTAPASWLDPAGAELLIPYAGERLDQDQGYLYGLMGPDGQILIEPEFSNFSACGDMLILRRGGERDGSFAVADIHGRWATEFDYCAALINDAGLTLFTEDRVILRQPDGEIRSSLTAEDLGISDEEFANMLVGAETHDSCSGTWAGDLLAIDYDGADILCYDLAENCQKICPELEWVELFPPYEPEEPVLPEAFFIYDRLLGTDAPALLEVMDLETEPNCTYYLEDGTPLPQFDCSIADFYEEVNLVGGLVEHLSLQSAAYYTLDGMELVAEFSYDE